MSDAESIQPPMPEVESARFPSLASLRAAHTALLKRHREQGNDPAVLAEVEQMMRRGHATGAVLDSEDDRWTAQGLLDYWSSVLYRAGQVEPPDTTLVEFDPLLAPDLSDELCPYLGLEAFRAENQHLFFGRQRLLDKLLKHLECHRLLMVVGSSGSGKSSVVLGGVLPRLVAGALSGSRNWIYYAPLVPGSDPLAALARRLKPVQVAVEDWVPQQVKAFQTDSSHLLQLVTPGETQAVDRQPVVLFIDQFEEVFTLCQDEAVREALVQNLINFVQAEGPQNRLILTMRTDFESQLVRLPGLLGLFEESHIRTTALEATELRQAIREPAALVGLKFEEGLVDELLGDVLGEPAALPLLQFTLLKLWDHRERNRVTWEAYRRLGGGRLALAKSADEFYHSLIPEEQVTMRRILLRMVRPDEGLEVTSRRIPQSGLYMSGEAEDRVDRVLERLILARLVRLTEGELPDDAQVEVAHEALIRNWPRLGDWLEDERTSLRQRLRLTAAAEQWQNKKRDSSTLIRGVLLEEAGLYEDLSGLETEFVRASRRSAKRKWYIAAFTVTLVLLSLSGLTAFAFNQAKLARDQAELASERELEAKASEKEARDNAQRADFNAREAQKNAGKAAINAQEAEEQREIAENSVIELKLAQRKLAQALAQTTEERELAEEQRRVAQVQEQIANEQQQIAAAEAVIANEQRTIAREQTLEAEQQTAIVQILRDSAIAKNRLQTPDRLLGLLLAIATTDRSQASEPEVRKETIATASGSLLLGLQMVQEQNLLVHEDAVNSVAVSSDGNRIVSGSKDGTVWMWDATTGQLMGQLLQVHEDAVNSVAVSSDGNRIVSGSDDGTLRIWDAATGQPIGQPLQGHRASVWSVAVSPDGNRIVSGSNDGTLRIWDVATGQPIGQPLQGHGASVRSVAVSPDGNYIVSGSSDRTVRIWDATTGQPIGQPLREHVDAVNSVAFSPDGNRIVSGSNDANVRIWDAGTGQLTDHQPLQGLSKASVRSVAFSPDGNRIISGSSDRTVRIWDAVTGRPIGQPLRDHEVSVWSVAISPDGRRIVSGDRDGSIRIWDAVTGQLLGQPLLGHEDRVRALAFSPDGNRIISGSYDGTVRIWDANTGQPIGQPLRGHEESVFSVAISPDGNRIASGSYDRTVRIWDADTGQPIGQPLRGHEDLVLSVAFSPDGNRIASGSYDRTVRIWDADTGQPIGPPLEGHKDWVTSVAFSSDGSRIVSGSADKTVRILESNWSSWMRLACQRLEYHPLLTTPETLLLDQESLTTAKDSKAACDARPWLRSTQPKSRFYWQVRTLKRIAQFWL